MADSRTPLPPVATQPTVTAHIQADYLDNKSIASASKTCRSLRTLFSEPLAKRRRVLLQHVVHGEQKEAEAIIQKHPELLLIADNVMDYSGRTLKQVTPVTAAYGADDADMLKMMFTYLDNPSKEKAVQQIKETFPEEKESQSYDFSHMIKAFNTNKNIDDVLAQFRKDFTPGVIEKGKHFNMSHLIGAYEAFSKHSYNWTVEQRSLFLRQVIGYLERLLPACYAQTLCQGLIKVAEGKAPLERRLQLEDGSFFYPPVNSESGRGFDVSQYHDDCMQPFTGGLVAVRVRRTIETLCVTKCLALQDIIPHVDSEQDDRLALFI